MYNTKFENVPDIFWAPGLALVMVAGKMLVRLKIASDVLVLVAVLVLVLVLVAAHMPNPRELTDHVHVHDPMHNSVFVHVISCYLHSFIVLLLVFYYAM